MNAYEVLGVSPQSSPDEVKKRYRSLVKEFHPDLNPGDEKAAQRMAEINYAYELVKSGKAKEFKPDGTFTRNGVEYSYHYEDISDILRKMFGMEGYGQDKEFGNYAFVEMYIKGNNYTRAAKLLDTMPKNDARWFYYAAHIYRHTGDYEKAIYNARAAAVMDPSRTEYYVFLDETEKECSAILAKKERAVWTKRIIAGGLAFIFVVYFLMTLL